MAKDVEGRHTAEHLISEAPGSFSRENVTIKSGQVLKAGHVLGRERFTTPATTTAFAGNTGTGTFAAAPVVGAGAKQGRNQLVFVEPIANAGTYLVFDPDGILIGRGQVGAAFAAGGLSFTLDDATDFVSGDGFFIDVPAGTLKYRELDLASAVGAEVAVAILYAEGVDATAGDLLATAHVRGPCEVQLSRLTWPAGISGPQKTAALAQLAAAGIIAR
jgi:hypothetical protein